MECNDLTWILEWFDQHCDGDWEHSNGIKLGTIDNPGWFLKVSINETDLQDREFKPIEINRSQNDWIYCSVKNGLFEEFGGPFNIVEILNVFREWVQSVER